MFIVFFPLFFDTGKGLGKNEDGIIQPLKPELKLDTAGIGHKETLKDEWWENYNKAVKNIIVTSHNGKVSLSKVQDNCDTTSSKNHNKAKTEYGNFLKTSTLYNGHLVEDSAKPEKEETERNPIHSPLTNAQLFELCGDRIAKHIHKSSGKLKRLEQQDATFLNASTSDVFQSNISPFRENVMAHRSTDAKSDLEEDKTQSDTDILQHKTKRPFIMTKSMSKRCKKKMNKLTEQLSTFNINKNDETCKHKKMHRKHKRSEKERASSSPSRDNLKDQGNNESYEYVFLPHDIPVERRKESSTEKKKKEIQDYKATREEHAGVSNEVTQKTDESISKKKRKKKAKKRECPSIVIQIESDDDTYLSELKRFKRSLDKNIAEESICTNDRAAYTSSDEKACKAVRILKKNVYRANKIKRKKNKNINLDDRMIKQFNNFNCINFNYINRNIAQTVAHQETIDTCQLKYKLDNVVIDLKTISLTENDR